MRRIAIGTSILLAASLFVLASCQMVTDTGVSTPAATADTPVVGGAEVTATVEITGTPDAGGAPVEATPELTGTAVMTGWECSPKRVVNPTQG